MFFQSIFVMSVINYSELTYDRHGSKGKYEYPSWAVGVGWALAATSAVWIPVVALLKWFKHGADIRVSEHLEFIAICTA